MVEADDPSLDDIVELLKRDEDYCDGTRALPRALSRDEVLLVVDDIYGATQAADASIFRVAEKMHKTIACARSCPGRCCESLILISEPEALAICRELQRPDMGATLRLFSERFIDWAAAAQERAQEAADALADGDPDRYLQLVHEHGLGHFMCPLNSDAACDVHAARPLPCRKVWVVDSWEYCAASAEPNRPNATVISNHPVEEFFAQAKRVCAGLQHGMGNGVKREPLATAVARLLT